MARKDTGYTLAELNERYKDKPTSKAVYEVDGQRYAVTPAILLVIKTLTRCFMTLLSKERFRKPKRSKVLKKRLAIFGFLRYNSCNIEYGLL